MKVQKTARGGGESWSSSTKDTGCDYQEKHGKIVIRSIVISHSCFDCPLTVCKLEPDGGHAALNAWKISQGIPLIKRRNVCKDNITPDSNAL